MSCDIDLDFADRNEILQYIQHVPAVLTSGLKHASGVYVCPIPANPFTGLATLDYKQADDLGYFKIDFLNQSVYRGVKSPEHLESLLSQPPDWNRLNTDPDFVSRLSM